MMAVKPMSFVAPAVGTLEWAEDQIATLLTTAKTARPGAVGRRKRNRDPALGAFKVTYHSSASGE